MEAKELQREIMIGNYLLGKCEDDLDERKEWWEVYQIKDAEDLMGIKDGWDERIPLTEEWLLKFGFEKRKNSNTFEWKDGDYRSIQIEIKKTTFEIYLCGCYSATSQECFPVDDIKFVHQLQNLYFAVTGKELTIK